VYLLNARCFTLLKEFALQNRELWSPLDAQAIQRAARFPFLVLDVYFSDESWWQSMPRNPPSAMCLWPAEVAKQLMGELIVFAWHTAKWDRRVARVSLGMAPRVAEAVAALTPEQLDSFSARHSGALRLRWQDHADFWGRLVAAACAGNDNALADIQLHAKLLLCGELLGTFK
jgi:hypothetical protein